MLRYVIICCPSLTKLHRYLPLSKLNFSFGRGTMTVTMTMNELFLHYWHYCASLVSPTSMWFCILASHTCSEKVNYAWLDFILPFPNIPFVSVYGAICWESSTLNDLTKFAALAQPRFWRENESPHSQGFSPEGSNPRKNLVEHRGWMRRDQRSGLALPRHNAFGEICLK